MKIPVSLEYKKILELLAQKALSGPGAQQAMNLQPQGDIKEARFLMEKTMEAETILLHHASYPVRGFSAINAELKRMKAGASLSAGELLRVCGVMRAAKHAAALAKDENGQVIPAMAQGLFFDDAFIHRVEESIIAEDEIADGASSELARIRRAIRKENEFIREKLQGMIKNSSKYLQDAIITQRGGRYVVPVKTEHKGDVAGIVHEKSASGATLFVEPASVVEANNRIRELEGAEAAEIAAVLQALTAMVSGYREELKADVELLTELDILFAKASLAREMKAVPVEFNEDNIIEIKEGRHPLIEADRVVPVTVNMHDGITALIVTGPNTGGKTVTLKLVGLFCAMAQSGFLLPALGTVKLPVFDGIFADIGDEQSIEQSLSTFSAHMKSIIYAVKHAGNRSLVLLDELGAGTDPQEGSALAQAVLAHLHGNGAMLIATTHIGELKAFATAHDGFENASMEFNAATLTPTYRLIMGVAGRSNALAISKSLGLPAEIIQAAQGYMQSETVEYNRLIEVAEKERAKAAKNLRKSNDMLQDARRERERAERALEKAAEKRKKILEKANEKAIEIIDDARDATEEAIEIAKKLKTKPEAQRTQMTQQVRQTLAGKKQTIEKHKKLQKRHQALEASEIREGDTVLIISMDAPATVLEPPNAKGMVKLQAGILKMELPVGELAKTEQEAQQQKQYFSSVNLKSRSNISASIDLHGQTVDDATVELDKYLDDAFLSGLQQVTVIHGRGTGALMKGVRAHLRNHPHVKKMRQGEYDEGGPGATIVELK
ncbi:endonuclease MutS2 [Christensenellaceae bacterium OttesenSCG-928-K19]|nr:endonuclease MutS2 [Christensenellaceae bacterium OttesenSCG-928-K19]